VLDEIVREGARKMLQAAIEAEATAVIEQSANVVAAIGFDRAVRGRCATSAAKRSGGT
jgi:hypothetical protein